MGEDEIFNAAKSISENHLGYDVSHSMRLKNAITELEETILDLVISGARREFDESEGSFNPSMIPLNINNITLAVIRQLSDSMYRRSLLGYKNAMENARKRRVGDK